MTEMSQTSLHHDTAFITPRQTFLFNVSIRIRYYLLAIVFIFDGSTPLLCWQGFRYSEVDGCARNGDDTCSRDKRAGLGKKPPLMQVDG